MFDRFIRFAQIRRALESGRLEQALRLTEDPLVSDDRRAGEARRKALAGVLSRARQRLLAGQEAAVRQDLALLERHGADASAIRKLTGDLQQCETARDAARQQIQEDADHALELLRCGELLAAQELLANQASANRSTERWRQVARLIESRLNQAQTSIAAAQEAAKAGHLEDAGIEFQRAAGLAQHLPGLAELKKSLADAWRSRLMDLLATADDVADLDRVQSAIAAVPKVVWQGESLRLLQSPCEALTGGLLALEQGDPVAALAQLQAAVDSLPCRALDRQLKRLRTGAAQAEQVVAEASTAFQADETGQADGRGRLLTLLRQWPGHPTARDLLRRMDEQQALTQRRLRRLRDCLEQGRLQRARRLLAGLATSRSSELESLTEQLDERSQQVEIGLRQVRRTIHGSLCASEKGVEQCLAKLRVLQQVQSDHEGLNQVISGLEAERDALALFVQLKQDVASDDAEGFAGRLQTFSGLRQGFLDPGRLDARLNQLLDEAMSRMEQAAHSGRLRLVDAWQRALPAVPDDARSLYASRILLLQTQVETSRQRARSCLHAARQAITVGAMEQARDHLAEARQAWIDCPEADSMQASLERVTDQDMALAEVQSLAEQEDFGAANQRLAQMPPTPRFLATRIFDIKQGIAMAQGLAETFLLRVDEGGEFLVARHDAVTFGNVRDGTADLQVLARIAGQHARLRRSMSFHGGMQDSIEGIKGEVAVNGSPVRTATLADGDVVALGGVLQFRYRLPGSRSLSALLQLRGGFQVASTDKVILMKDRGRDGRILIGKTAECHARVARAGETPVEVYAAPNGEIRVRAESGSIDGKPFSGEAAVVAGARIVCGEISFELRPVPA